MIESVELMIKQPGHADRTVRLPEGATRMGRAEDNEVVLADVGVSRRHAQVYVSRTEVTVEDLGSGNGTYYNGYRVQSQAIQDGDEVVIDPFVLQFRVRGGAAAPRAESSSPKAQSAARLEVVVGTGMAGSSYPITSRGLSIGRSEDRDVVIPDPAASRHHGQISVQGADYVLRDMGSSNGIYVNGVRVRECTLADGDMVRIGNTEMRFARYDEGAAGNDRTAQMQASAPAAPRQPAYESPAPMATQPAQSFAPRPRKSRMRSILAVLFGTAFLAFLAVIVVLVLLVIVVVWFKFYRAPGVAMVEPRPPRWELKLEDGLPAATLDALFAEGQARLNAGDQRGALQDFYRVLATDPKYRVAGTFALAAGEYMVLDMLQKEFSDHAAEQMERRAERDRLLKVAANGPRTQSLEAKNILRRKFKEDPVVIDALELPRPDTLVALDKKLALADEKAKVAKFDDAVLLYREVLAETDDPARRREVLANHAAASLEVARTSAPQWTEAVMAERTNPEGGRALFQALLQAHPANPSAQIHLGKQ